MSSCGNGFRQARCFVVQKAKEQGDFLLVGLHTDEDVAERRGPHLPIMDLHERCLSVLACKYVDEAIIGTHTHAGRAKFAAEPCT